MINKKKLIEYFVNGIKEKSNIKIGTEHEKFILSKNSLKPLTYEKKNGIRDIFFALIDLGWQPVKEGKNIIGLKYGKQNITLEPAGQFELSGEPLDNIHQTCREITNHLNQMKNLSSKYDFVLLGIGVEPSLKLNEFHFMPKIRYEIMKNYMPKKDSHGLNMMKNSCSTQVNFDYVSEQDMIKKFRVLLSFESIGTAIFANSPFFNKQITEYKSLRSFYWLHTDKDRTGILPFVFNEDFNFETYVEYALNVPMYFIKRNNKYFDVTGIKFKNFLDGKLDKLPNEIANITDWKDHLTTLFPQVRLKQYLELRSMDACSWNEICGQPAFWTGIIYDNDSLDEAWSICEKWTNEERIFLYKNSPKFGLQTPFRNEKILDIAKRLLKISFRGLKNRNRISKNGYDERHYLLNLEKNLSNNLSPADKLIKDYNYKWKKDIYRLYEENIF